MFDLEARPIRLSVFGRSHPGRVRRDNQDDFLVADLDAAEGGYILRPEGDGSGVAACGEFLVGRRGVLLLVADGMGGGAGAVASRLATTWIHDTLTTTWAAERVHTSERFAALLAFAVKHANGRIHRQAAEDAALRGMGTTATAVGLIDRYFYLAHVGDSRAYLVRSGEATQLTHDQSVVQAMIDAGTLTEEQAEASGQGNLILQALGATPQVNVELTYLEARRGDVLLLCSDGLSKLVRRTEIGEIIEETHELVAACDQLIDLANQRGGPDNVTAVLARVDGDGLEVAAMGDTVTRQPLVLPDS
jgi:protein phosphatase